MKKIFSFLFILFTLFICLNSVQAVNEEKSAGALKQNIINFGIFDGDFVSSINKFKKVLPFINVATKNMTYDTDVSASGLSFSNQSITVKNSLKGVQVLTAMDTVTIDNSCEYGVIFATNVVIKGKIEKDILIMAQSVFITDTAEIGNDITIVASKVEVKGKIKGNLLGTAEDLTVYGNISKDLRMNAKTVKFENEKISGDIYLSTDSNTASIIKKYPNAVIENYTSEVKNEDKSIDVYSVVTEGIVVVFTYTLVAYLLNKKGNNIIQKATNKFEKYMPFTFLMGILMLLLLPVILIGLLIFGVMGLGVIAWPIFVAYLSFIILTCILDVLIVGLVLINIIISKIDKEKLNTTKKIFIYLGIFASIYVLKYFFSYAAMLCAITSIGIVFTTMTRKIDKDKNAVKVKVDETKN